MVQFRYTALRWLGAALFLGLSLGYARLGTSLPAQNDAPSAQTQRGQILAGDQSVLAYNIGTERFYPQGDLAAPLLGFVGADGGLEGAEKAFESQLAAGQSVQLTINPKLQGSVDALLTAAVERHQAEFGSLIVMESATGHLLAVSSAPGYDLQHWQDYPPARWRNRAFLDQYEPGSIGKALTVAALLHQKRVDIRARYPTPMTLPVEGHLIHDTIPHPGEMNVGEILRYSSNTGMTHLVSTYPSQEFYQALKSYGFGSFPGTGLPEAEGTLRSPEQWGVIGQANHSFGQGYAVSTLQMVAAFNVLADGAYRRPVVQRGERPVPVQVLNAKSAQQTRELLRQAALATHPDQPLFREYRLAGKTGTAQVVENRVYSPDKFVSTYAGFAPADAPEITVALMLYGAQRGHHGSESGAPLFAEVVSSYFSLKGTPPL